jgi:hypothetical protein
MIHNPVDVGIIPGQGIQLTNIVNIHLNWVDVIFAGKIIMPPKSHLLILSKCYFGGMIISSLQK